MIQGLQRRCSSHRCRTDGTVCGQRCRTSARRRSRSAAPIPPPTAASCAQDPAPLPQAQTFRNHANGIRYCRRSQGKTGHAATANTSDGIASDAIRHRQSLIADRVWEKCWRWKSARRRPTPELDLACGGWPALGVDGGAVRARLRRCGPSLLGSPVRRTRARTGPEQQGATVMPNPTPPPAARLTELPKPVFTDDRATLYLGDAVELLPLLPEASIDALVTDPPYGLSFNGQAWDDASGFRESLPHIDTS